MSRGPGRALLVSGVIVAALTGCAQSAGADCPPTTAYAGPSDLAETIGADRLGTVTDGRDEPGLSTLALESQRSVADLRRRLGPAMARAGLQVLSEDNEGFEAEMYFGADDGTSAVARIRENPLCEGRTTVQISVSRETSEPAAG
ncbi:MAG TPA: hypothetical protein VFV76_02010 [Actinomycetes bacterium]|nr:hypothetical protein [Actinomycetes bacterium]